MDYLKKILLSRVYEVAHETPLNFCNGLSEKLANNIFIKREDLQPIYSFKIRGAYNKIANLSEEDRKKGVIAASAGNHAQGVAFAAKKFGCRALIVMPVPTPSIKVKAVKRLGAEVLLEGESYAESYAIARRVQEEQKMTFVHPYDDPDVIAGQGTVGLEIVKQSEQKLDAIFIPVGGGGLIAGVALAVKALMPNVKIIGVEPTEAASMYESLKVGNVIQLPWVGTFADGVATKSVGLETFRICKNLVDEVILVDNDQICAAVKDVYEDSRVGLEPSGALSIAGMKAYIERENLENKNLCAIASGANMNFNRLQYIAERADYGEQKEAVFAVTIPERPGAFRELCTILEQYNITEFNYRYSSTKEAHIYIGVEVQTKKRRKVLLELFKEKKLNPVDLTENEAAKLHIRHMVGGRVPEIQDEHLYRFQFPERPGALMKFLSNLNPKWNISLFHYRSHGSDVGRVLAGIQVPLSDSNEFKNFLNTLGYDYFNETDNLACKLFL